MSQSRRSADPPLLPPLVPKNLASDLGMWWIRTLGMCDAGVSTESPRSAPLMGMMPLLLVKKIAESAQQVFQKFFKTESVFSFIGKGNFLTAASGKKSGFRTFDSTSTAHSFLTGFVPGFRRQRGNGPKYHGLLERWARRNCSFDTAFSPSMVKRKKWAILEVYSSLKAVCQGILHRGAGEYQWDAVRPWSWPCHGQVP